MHMLDDYEQIKSGKLKGYLSCFFDEKLYREYKSEEAKFRAKIKRIDDESLRRLTYRIIPMGQFLIYYLSGDHMNEKSYKIKEFYTAIVDQTMMKKLEDSRTINWWTGFCNRLYVSRTETDLYGTLYASASIAMWGFQDSKSLMLHRSDEIKNNLSFKDPELSFNLRKQKSETNSGIDLRMDADFDAYILSNALRRPIIIFEYNGDINHIRVYLPSFYTPDKCCKDPLILAYYLAKYYPILQMEQERPFIKRNLVPLNFDHEGFCELADIPFKGSKTEMERMRLFEKYMDVVIRQDDITIDLIQPEKYTCARIGSNDPSYYYSFKDFKKREIGIMQICELP